MVISAPHSGKIGELSVKNGDSVDSQDLICKILKGGEGGGDSKEESKEQANGEANGEAGGEEGEENGEEKKE